MEQQVTEKGLIYAMSSFGVKYILQKDITGLDVWFEDSAEICEYLTMGKGPPMSYSIVN